MAAALDDAAGVKDAEPIDVADGLEPMSEHHGRDAREPQGDQPRANSF